MELIVPPSCRFISPLNASMFCFVFVHFWRIAYLAYMSCNLKFQASINWHLIVAYSRTQLFFRSTKIKLKRFYPMEPFLGYPDYLRIIPSALEPK